MIGEMESELGDELIRGWGAQECMGEIGPSFEREGGERREAEWDGGFSWVGGG